MPVPVPAPKNVLNEKFNQDKGRRPQISSSHQKVVEQKKEISREMRFFSNKNHFQFGAFSSNHGAL